MTDDSAGCRVWVGGLPQGVEEKELADHFERFGEVEHVHVRSSQRDVFAFVKYKRVDDAEECIQKTDQQTIFGSKVAVRIANSAGPKGKMGGGGGGGGPGGGRGGQERRRDDSRPPPRRRDDSRDRGRSGGDPRERDGYRRDVRDDYRRDDGYRRDVRDDYRKDDRRDDYRDRDRDGGRGRDDDDGRRRRSRTRSRSRGRNGHDSKGGKKGDSKVPQGGYKITVENIPEDMTWHELKDLGRNYGNSVTFARTFRARGTFCGLIEFSNRSDAEYSVRELDKRRVEGCTDRLRCYHGDGQRD